MCDETGQVYAKSNMDDPPNQMHAQLSEQEKKEGK